MGPDDPTPPVDSTSPPGDSTPPPNLWAAAPDSASPRGRRVPLALAWGVALVIAGASALLAYRSGSGSEGYRLGLAVGSFVGPFLLALVLRAVFAWVRPGAGSARRPTLRSAWIPIGATIIAGLALSGRIVSLAPAAPVDPASAMRISGPFSLQEASADTRQIAEAGLKGNRSIRAYEVREVVGDDGSLSLLVVVDGPLRDGVGSIEGVARGIESASGLTGTIESIRGTNVAVAVGETLSIGAWIEEPLGFYVYAVTPTRLHAIIEAILDAPKQGARSVPGAPA
jgi:hypothetical protein